MKYNYIFIYILFAFGYLNGQTKIEKKAEIQFDNYAFENAIEAYEYLISKNYSSYDAYKNLGDAYYNLGEYSRASEWYGKQLSLPNESFDITYVYKYAQTLKSTGELNEANKWLQTFLDLSKADNRANLLKAQPNYLNEIDNNSGRFTIKNSAINSSYEDFAPSYYGEKLIFSSARDTGLVKKNIHLWDNGSFNDLYIATDKSDDGDFANSELFSKLLNSKSEETSSVFTKDGKTIYFTRNNFDKKNFKRDEDGVSGLKIYSANLVNNEWTNIKELPFNGDDYSTAHPALSSDESKLYFVSDMPGSLGLSDIYVVSIGAEGSFGAPVNLGPSINTESRETFPFITDDNVMYFASDGHPGLGGLDVFVTKLNISNDFYVQNVGKPINGPSDDFGFIINNQKGFFSSNREGGKGGDDIYSFTQSKKLELIKTKIINGIVRHEHLDSIISSVNVDLVDLNNEKIESTVSSVNGDFNFSLPLKEGNYKLITKKEAFVNDTTSITVKPTDKELNLIIKLNSVPIEKAIVGNDLFKLLQLDNLYFDYNKWNIRKDQEEKLNEIVEYLNLYPDLNIQVKSYSDSRGGEKFNQKLSEKRADATKSYLILNGIKAERIKSNGFGESNLLNDCINGVDCTEKMHEINRRSEFIVIDK